MQTTDKHFTGMQWGLSIWQGSAPHVGVTYGQSSANLPIKASHLAKRFAEFQAVNVWTMDGWLITACVLFTGYVKCTVRKGKQVATLTTPDESLFFHNAAQLHKE